MIIRPIIATHTITYYPEESYFDYCKEWAITPTEEGFLEFLEPVLRFDFARVPDVEFLDPPEGEE